MMSRAINRIKDDYVKGIATIKTIEQYMADGDVVDLSKIDLSKLTDLEQYALSIAVKKMKEAIEKKKPIMFIQYEPIVGIINEIKMTEYVLFRRLPECSAFKIEKYNL